MLIFNIGANESYDLRNSVRHRGRGSSMICDTLLQVFKNTSFEDMVEIFVREDEHINTYYYQADAHRAIKSDFYEIGVTLFGNRWASDPNVKEIAAYRS